MVTNSGTTGASYHDENTGKFTPSGSAGLDISGGIGGEPGAKMSEDRFRYWLNDIAEYIKNSRQ